MKAIGSGDIAWASGEPPRIRGPWEAAICHCVEQGDSRFVPILAAHVRAGRIVSERARKALKGAGVECSAASVER